MKYIKYFEGFTDTTISHIEDYTVVYKSPIELANLARELKNLGYDLIDYDRMVSGESDMGYKVNCLVFHNDKWTIARYFKEPYGNVIDYQNFMDIII